MAAPKLNTFSSQVASAGSRAARKRRKPSRTAAGSWPGTSRNDTFAPASEGITVFEPGPL